MYKLIYDELCFEPVILQIFKEEVFDLLDQNPPVMCKGEGARAAGHTRAPIQIRETANGGITLAGVTEAEVKTKEEMASYLLQGAVSRATASTNMNSQSRYYLCFLIASYATLVSSRVLAPLYWQFCNAVININVVVV